MIIWNIFKNNFFRVLSKRSIIATGFIVIPAMIFCAVYVSGKAESKGHIALVSENQSLEVSDESIDIELVDEKPEIFQLIDGEYDAIVVDNKNGSFDVETLKSEKAKKSVEEYFNDKGTSMDSGEEEDDRGAGTKVLALLIIFLLPQAVSLMVFYPEDRDFGVFRRLLTSPASAGKYLIAQGLFNFMIIFIPTYVSLLLAKAVFNVEFGFNNIMLALLLGLVLLFGTSFALFMTTINEDLDNSLLLGSGIAIVTSVLSGCINPIDSSKKVLNTITNIFPQKNYLNLLQQIEKGNGSSNYILSLVYMFFVIVLLWLISTRIISKKVKKGQY